jgi:amidase
MALTEAPWEAKAASKRRDTYAKIPEEWRLGPEDLAKAARQRDLTGQFIEQYLSGEDIAIIRLDSVSLVTKIQKSEYSAVQVVRAFCKTAAIAHQIVSAILSRE